MSPQHRCRNGRVHDQPRGQGCCNSCHPQLGLCVIRSREIATVHGRHRSRRLQQICQDRHSISQCQSSLISDRRAWMTVSTPRPILVSGLFLAFWPLLILITFDPALAQPFGLHSNAAPEPGGFTSWILAEQAKFYLKLSSLIRASKADGSAAYTLLGISFIYGVFHAAGPGHGKAVISSYLVANDETWRRGIVLSFASAILQAFTAIAIVAVAAVLLGATAKAMGDTVRVIEIVSYALIIAIGLRLLWVKGGALLALLRPGAHEHQYRHHDHVHDHHHADRHHGHGQAHDHHDHGDEASAWGHAHGPEPRELTGRHWLRRGLLAIVAVGLRPCSGAIIVLAFPLAQGLV